MTTPKLITAPSVEPVSVTEAKSAHNISISDDDTLIGIFIKAAREYFEWRTGRTVHETVWEYVLENWPAKDYIALPRATPLISITSVIYKDSDGAATTWSSSEYIADSDEMPGRVVLAYNQSWPSFTPYPVSPIRIRYKAGIATASPVTEADAWIKLPILLLVGGMYANRESEIVTNFAMVQETALKYGVEAFISCSVVSYAF